MKKGTLMITGFLGNRDIENWTLPAHEPLSTPAAFCGSHCLGEFLPSPYNVGFAFLEQFWRRNLLVLIREENIMLI